MYLEWWMLCVLIVVSYLFTDWYATKLYKIGHQRGVQNGSEIMLALLLDQNFVKVVDPAALDPIFIAWPDESLSKEQK